jgi:hypothetical protein
MQRRQSAIMYLTLVVISERTEIRWSLLNGERELGAGL